MNKTIIVRQPHGDVLYIDGPTKEGWYRLSAPLDSETMLTREEMIEALEWALAAMRAEPDKAAA